MPAMGNWRSSAVTSNVAVRSRSSGGLKHALPAASSTIRFAAALSAQAVEGQVSTSPLHRRAYPLKHVKARIGWSSISFGATPC